MKKVIAVLGLVAVMGVLVTGVAFAQGGSPPSGGLIGRRLNADPQPVQLELDGTMHDDLLAAISDATGIPVSELETRIEAGETMAAILEGEGLDIALLREIMFDVRSDAIQSLVADGTITQEQADWMLERQSINASRIGDCTEDPSMLRQQGGGSMGRAAGRGN